MMATRITRIAALPLLAGLLALTVACTTQEPTPDAEPSESVATPVTPTPEQTVTASPTSTPSREEGYAMSCRGTRADGSNVVVELYTNSAYDVPASVVVTQAGEDGEPILIPGDGAAEPTVTDGEVTADVPLIDAASRDDAGTAEVRGTIEPTGQVRQVNNDFEDAGERIQTTGTNEDLTTDLAVTIGEEQVDLECSDAFRFDLQVTKTPIS